MCILLNFIKLPKIFQIVFKISFWAWLYILKYFTKIFTNFMRHLNHISEFGVILLDRKNVAQSKWICAFEFWSAAKICTSLVQLPVDPLSTTSQKTDPNFRLDRGSTARSIIRLPSTLFALGQIDRWVDYSSALCTFTLGWIDRRDGRMERICQFWHLNSKA